MLRVHINRTCTCEVSWLDSPKQWLLPSGKGLRTGQDRCWWSFSASKYLKNLWNCCRLLCWTVSEPANPSSVFIIVGLFLIVIVTVTPRSQISTWKRVRKQDYPRWHMTATNQGQQVTPVPPVLIIVPQKGQTILIWCGLSHPISSCQMNFAWNPWHIFCQELRQFQREEAPGTSVL